MTAAEILWLIAAILWTAIVALFGWLKGFDTGWDAAASLRDDMNAVMNRNPEAQPREGQ
jgi:hypothetical protein